MRLILTAFVLGSVLMSGVAVAGSNTSSKNYSREQTLTVRDIQEGVVVMVRPVHIDNRSKVNTGTALGAAIGAGAAQSVKNRDARTAARIVGTTAGAVAGGAVQRAMTGRQGLEIFIRTQARNGQQSVISVVQDADVDIEQGQRVLLSGRGKDLRVIPVPIAYQSR
ncbi:hypothetical protein [uncultured Stenotrophomonas sp.]|uniref:outer membrane lipoprotein n=1 Tax=uncultured Stenotrophomonas sp. TaxID=165438 RepID=UPI0028D00F9A|nr:hypothetical protein [uncultured Stenotrophomonas sp.]